MKNPDGDITSEIITDKGKLDYAVLSEYAEQKFQPVTFNRTLYIYNENNHLYEPDTDTVESWIQSKIEECIYSSLLSSSTAINSHKNEVYKRVYHNKVIPGSRSPFNNYYGIPVGNGVLHLDESGNIELENYKPDMLFTRQIPVNYNPDANPKPILKILNDWAGPENVSFLIQIPAQAIVQSLPDKAPLRKAYLLVGEAAAGKTTYLSLLEMIFEKCNISSVGLHQLGDRFNTCSLEGKFINAADDISAVTLKYADTFKTLVGRRTHDVEPKSRPRYITDLTAVHVYTCNRPPELDERVDIDDAWWDRWVIIPFQRYFKKTAGWKEKNLSKENLEGFLKIVVDEVSRIIENNGSLSFSQDLDDVRYQWRHESSPLHDFLDEFTERGINFSIAKDELFNALWSWADSISENDIKSNEIKMRLPQTKTSLSQKLIREGIEPYRKGKGSKSLELYRGIRWKLGCEFNKNNTNNCQII